MKVCRCAADVKDHKVSEAVVEDLCCFHYCARRRNDWTVNHLANVFHPRRIGYMLLKRVLDYAAAGLYV